MATQRAKRRLAAKRRARQSRNWRTRRLALSRLPLVATRAIPPASQTPPEPLTPPPAKPYRVRSLAQALMAMTFETLRNKGLLPPQLLRPSRSP